jgi:HPt (histidine-containing phosphotransfer) domain-containing protein
MTTMPASTPSRPLLPPIDAQVIENLRALDDGGDEFLLEVLSVFRAESPLRLAAIRRAAAGSASRELVGVAHALKGSARTLGLVRLAEVCQEIESLGKSGDCPSEEVLRRLEAEYTAVTEALASVGVREAD